jgi:hypothetical protein
MSSVISGFPGIGKMYFKQHSNLKVVDSDSSKFSWISSGVRNPDFPRNYINHIREAVREYDIVLVSSHDVVRDALAENCILFVLVFPKRNLKKEYLERFRIRGSSDDFIRFLDSNWNSFIDSMEAQEGCVKVRLSSGESLTDCFSLEGKMIR